MKTISDILLSDLGSEFSAYGINLEEFTIEAINISPDTLGKFSADKEMVRRYKLREEMFKNMRESQREDQAISVEQQIRLIQAIGEAEKNAKDERDINVFVTSE